MRTRHLDENGEPRYTNRLLHEYSPYLVQHAHNPVDWYPWGDEAFEKAQAEDKPIFLSIGYSTCHWCHVMEQESFDDEQVAAYLNEHFVSIKLDREQRPDLDDIYMTGLQLLTGQGGWPMSNFLTHQGNPFFAGTYYPREQFMAILQRIVDVWNTRREDLLKQAQEITDAIAQYTTARMEAATIDEDLVARATGELLDRFDAANGGFGGAPKFPNESIVLLMFEDWFRNANRDARDSAIRTLEKMCRGGIYDQIAGGFHRYTVDERWLVPHFEKMLYNQAQLVRVYLAGYAATGNTAFRRIVTDTVDYVLRDMTDDSGRFYSATDADSEDEEGRFFVWTPAEIDEALTPRDATLVKELYGVTEAGNFGGKNILHLEESLDDYAARHGLGLDAFLDRLDGIRQQLYEVRGKRVHPLRDEKIITAWNGMMITAIALAGHRLGEDRFIQAAAAAAGAVWDSVVSRDAGLYRIVMGGQASIPGNLEDYACLAEALLTLYAVSEDDVWLERAGTLIDDMLALFRDTENGGFWFSRESGEGPLILRPKSPMDGATPSGNSVALNALVMLSRMKSDASLDTVTNESLSAYAGLLKASPSAFAYMVLAVADFLRGPVSPLQFAAGGQVRVDASREGATIAVDIAIAEGWHINAHESGEAQFPGTRLAADAHTRLEVVDYPPGESRSTGFHDKPLNLYEGKLSIEAHLADSDEGAPVGIKLQLQACSDERCLAPETLQFRL